MNRRLVLGVLLLAFLPVGTGGIYFLASPGELIVDVEHKGVYGLNITVSPDAGGTWKLASSRDLNL